MPNRNDRATRKEDTRQASTIIAVFSLVGLTVCITYSIYQKTTLPIFVYAIFGGGVLGTDNILKLIKSIFRVDR